MNKKNVRYISWAIVSLMCLAILMINDGSFSRHGLFVTDINDTMIYELYRGIARSANAGFSASKNWAYFLWYLTLATSIFISWKIRFKTAVVIGKILSNLHEKA